MLIANLMDCSSFIVNSKYNHFRAGIELREVLEIGRGFILILPICSANLMEETEIHLSAGESIEFIILDQSDKKNLKKLSLSSICFRGWPRHRAIYRAYIAGGENSLPLFEDDVRLLKAHFKIAQPYGDLAG
jgi:hypothetical protein